MKNFNVSKKVLNIVYSSNLITIMKSYNILREALGQSKRVLKRKSIVFLPR